MLKTPVATINANGTLKIGSLSISHQLHSKSCSAFVKGQGNGDNPTTIPRTSERMLERGQQPSATGPEGV